MKNSTIILTIIAFAMTAFTANAAQQDSLIFRLVSVNQNSAQVRVVGYNVQLGGVFVKLYWGVSPHVNDSTVNQPYHLNAGIDSTIIITLNNLANVTGYSGRAQEEYPDMTKVSPVVTFTTVACSVPSINASSDATICAGANTQLSANGGVFYNWIPSAGLSNANVANPVATPNATTAYIVTVTDANGCKGKDTVNVAVLAAPVASTSPAAFCKGSGGTISASGGGTYYWNTGATTSAIAVAPLVSTTYSVIVTDANGCTVQKTALATVNVNNTPLSFSTAKDTVCANGVAPVALMWSPATAIVTGTGVQGSSFVAPSTAANYTLTETHTDANGCKAYAYVTEHDLPAPVITNVNGYNLPNLIINGVFPYEVELEIDQTVYQTVTQNSPSQAIFYVTSLDTGKMVILKSKSGGCSAFWTFGTTGVNEVLKSEDVKVGPNPFTSILNVSLPQGEYKVSLVNMVGQNVLTMSAKGNFDIERGDLKQGVYFIQILSGKSTITKKVVAQ